MRSDAVAATANERAAVFLEPRSQAANNSHSFLLSLVCHPNSLASLVCAKPPARHMRSYCPAICLGNFKAFDRGGAGSAAPTRDEIAGRMGHESGGVGSAAPTRDECGTHEQ